MLDVRFVAENLDFVKSKMATRSGSYNVDVIGELDKQRRNIIIESETLKANRNVVTKEIELLKRNKQNADQKIKEMQESNLKIKELDQALSLIEEKLSDSILNIPNIPDETVPVGKDESDNKVVRSFGTPRSFDFPIKPHWDIGENLDIIDFNRGVKISGARFAVYKGLGAKLERAIMNLMLDTHFNSGYEEVYTPFIVNRDSMVGTGQIPKFEDDMFAIKDSNMFLIPTAEVPVTNLLRGETVDEKFLTKSFCAYSACFRGEAGSSGRDTRGIIRMHQFNKVELVKFTKPCDSQLEHEKLTADAEKILKILNLPYRVSLLCSGDTGFSSSKTYDLEVFIPSYGRYVEISSCSNFKDYQARRMNIKFKNSETNKTEFVHTLNGSGLAIDRTVAAVLENYQNADGTVTVPEALIPYIRTEIIK